MTIPKIKIERDLFDKCIEITTLAALVAVIGLPVIYYDTLPEVIPRHYNFNGLPDGFGRKAFIWILPVTGVLVYVGMAIAIRHPNLINFPKKLTKENAQAQFSMAIKVMRILRLFIVVSTAYIAHATIQTALGNQSGLGGYFLPVFFCLIFGTIAYYLYRSTKSD